MRQSKNIVAKSHRKNSMMALVGVSASFFLGCRGQDDTSSTKLQVNNDEVVDTSADNLSLETTTQPAAMQEILTETHYLTVSKTLPPNSHYIGGAYGESCLFNGGPDSSCFDDLTFTPVFVIDMEEIKFSAGKLAGQICTSSSWKCEESYSSCLIPRYNENEEERSSGFFIPGTFSTPYEAGHTTILKDKSNNTEYIREISKIKKMKSSSKVVRIDKNFKIYASEKTNLYLDGKYCHACDNDTC